MRYPKTNLREVMLLMFIAAIALAWWRDHRLQLQSLAQSKLRIAIYEEQVAKLSSDFRFMGSNTSGRFFAGKPYVATAAEFVDEFHAAVDDEDALELSSSLSNSRSELIDEVIPKLVAMLADTSADTRRRAAVALRFVQEKQPEAMRPHASLVVSALRKQVEREDCPEAIYALAEFGPAARPALDTLRQVMNDDDNFYAVIAAAAMHRIDPTIDVGPRMIELLHRKGKGWVNVPNKVVDHVPPDEATAELLQAYEKATSDAERQTIIYALNNVQLRKLGPPQFGGGGVF